MVQQLGGYGAPSSLYCWAMQVQRPNSALSTTLRRFPLHPSWDAISGVYVRCLARMPRPCAALPVYLHGFTDPGGADTGKPPTRPMTSAARLQSANQDRANVPKTARWKTVPFKRSSPTLRSCYLDEYGAFAPCELQSRRTASDDASWNSTGASGRINIIGSR